MFCVIYRQSPTGHFHQKVLLERCYEHLFKIPVLLVWDKLTRLENYPCRHYHPSKPSPHGSYQLQGANTSQAHRSRAPEPVVFYIACCSAPATSVICVVVTLPCAVLFLQRLVALSPGLLIHRPLLSISVPHASCQVFGLQPCVLTRACSLSLGRHFQNIFANTRWLPLG